MDWWDVLSVVPFEKQQPSACDPFEPDPWWRLLEFGKPVLMDQRHLVRMCPPTVAEILADALDLWYDVVEHPVALARYADDGCPNNNEE